MSQPATGSTTLGQQQLQQVQQQAAAVAQAQQQCAPFPAHQPDSAQVRMESQLIFDSCWRRFKEKHSMVSHNSSQLSQLGMVSNRIMLYRLLSRAVESQGCCVSVCAHRKCLVAVLYSQSEAASCTVPQAVQSIMHR